MATSSRYQAKWSKEKPGEALLAIEKDGVLFTARVKGESLVPRSMAEALLDAGPTSIAQWVKGGRFRVAARRRGRPLYLVSELYPLAKQRDLVP